MLATTPGAWELEGLTKTRKVDRNQHKSRLLHMQYWELIEEQWGSDSRGLEMEINPKYCSQQPVCQERGANYLMSVSLTSFELERFQLWVNGMLRKPASFLEKWTSAVCVHVRDSFALRSKYKWIATKCPKAFHSEELQWDPIPDEKSRGLYSQKLHLFLCRS